MTSSPFWLFLDFEGGLATHSFWCSDFDEGKLACGCSLFFGGLVCLLLCEQRQVCSPHTVFVSASIANSLILRDMNLTFKDTCHISYST